MQSSRFERDDPMAQCETHQVGHVVQVELLQDAFAIAVHGLDAEAQVTRDLLAGQPLGNEA